MSPGVLPRVAKGPDYEEGSDIIEALELTEQVKAALDGKQGKDILVVDVREQSAVTDFFVLVSGTSPPHVKALFNEVQHALKERGVNCFRRTGVADCGWLVVDYVDVVVHIFSEEAREYYALEDLWKPAPRVDGPEASPSS